MLLRRRCNPTPKQMNMHLDSSSHHSDGRSGTCRPSQPLPKPHERKSCALANLWLLDQIRQPGRERYAHCDAAQTSLSIVQFKRKLSPFSNSFKNSLHVSLERWAHCMGRKAIKLRREQGYSVQGTMWSACRNQEQRMNHRLQILLTSNRGSFRGDGKNQQA